MTLTRTLPAPNVPRSGSADRTAAQAGEGLGARAFHAAIGLVYLFLFLYVYEDYISIVWGYTGLYYRSLEIWEMGFIAGGVAIVTAALPVRIARPSSIILWLLYAFVYVPTIALTFMLGARSAIAYVPALGALTLVMVAASIVCQMRIAHEYEHRAIPDAQFAIIMTGAFLVISVVQYYVFGDILSFAYVDDIYYQRFAASEIGGGVMGYARTYYFYVISTGLFALGLCSSRYRLMAPLGFAGFVFSYMIDASKIALLVPVMMLAIYAIGRTTSNRSVIYTSGLAVLTGICSLLTSQAALIRFFADLILLRSISIPGQTFHQYFDLFTERGYTWWSNVRGINLFVAPPPGFSGDPLWPVLGYIIGREYYGSLQMNANANPFSGEGVAAGGAVGVLFIGVAMIAWLRALDLSSRGWNAMFALLIAGPLGLCLTNAHFSTMMLSFGGAFWLILFSLYKPGERWRARGRAVG